ncbi:MAG: glycoside hydrolase family 20 zincin-like fold domain-containing protein [Armatimonadota bacterium]
MSRIAMPSILAALVLASTSARPAAEPIIEEQARQWIRYLCPLPKMIRITGRIVVPSGSVPVVQEADNDLLTIMATKELRDALGSGANRATPPVRIVLRTGGPDAEPLRNLRNPDQAYRIITSPDGTRLSIVALTARGLYYGAKTLQQLLAAYATKDKVTIPVLEVTDWPDIQTRGFWGADNFNHLKWFGSLKFNLCEQISEMGVDENKRAYAVVKGGPRTAGLGGTAVRNRVLAGRAAS